MQASDKQLRFVSRYGMSRESSVRKKSTVSAGGMNNISAATEGWGKGAQLNVSGTTLPLPGRCSIVKSNCAKDKHQRANLEFCGVIEERNLVCNDFEFATH